MEWKALNSIEDWNKARATSEYRALVIFKHSTRCNISRMALKLTEQRWDLPSSVDAYILDLLTYREVSNAIESDLNVVHASPQMLVVVDGKSVYHANHHSIDPVDVKVYL